MSSTLAPSLPGVADPRALQQSLARAEKQRKRRAIALTLPLLLFLALTFLLPIGVLLKRAVENPEGRERIAAHRRDAGGLEPRRHAFRRGLCGAHA